MARRALEALLLAWAVAATVLALHYRAEVAQLSERYAELEKAYSELALRFNSTLIRVNILINYGNGTRRWANGTLLLRGSTAFDAIRRVARVEYTVGAYGVFIVGIDGVRGNQTHGWVFAVLGRKEASWGACVEVGRWVYPGVSADKVILKDGDVVAFLYYCWAKEGWPPPEPTS